MRVSGPVSGGGAARDNVVSTRSWHVALHAVTIRSRAAVTGADSKKDRRSASLEVDTQSGPQGGSAELILTKQQAHHILNEV